MRVNVYGIRGFPNVQGGVEKHCEQIYRLIAARGVDLKVFRRKPYLSKVSANDIKGIKFNDGWTVRNRYLETPVHSIISACKSIIERPDLVHVHNIGAAFTIPLLKLFHLKCVVTYHSANYEHSKWNFFAKALLRLSERIAFAFADRVIFVAKTKIASAKIDKSKAVLIPNGITKFDNQKPDISLKDYGLSKGSFILSVGRIVPEKRFSDLIEAFARLRTKKKLVIVGGFDNNAEYYNSLQGYRKLLGNRLIFTGYLHSNNVKLLYENAYCFVLPSENEGMPIVLLEAMSFGLCPLVSDIKENLDVIGEYGFSFKTKDIDDLKGKLELFLANKELILRKGSQAKRGVAKEYNWQSAADKTVELYRGLMK